MSTIQHLENCSCGKCKKPFVQIHCHSSFSNLDGAGLTKALVDKAKSYNHPALATTEHGNPAGLYDHYKTCKKNGVKPILGLEFYITNDLTARVAMKGREFEDKDFHQSIYIKNKEGYKNFNYLTYVSFTDGYYYKPRIDFDLLFSRSKGLMATTSCIASKINNYLTGDKMKEAEDLFKQYLRAFGDDFYGEIQFNELNDRTKWGIDQRRNNQFIIDMCRKHDVPLLIGGDVHYVEPEDNVLQDALINSKRQAKEGEEGFQIHARHLYFHDTSDYYDFNRKFGYEYDEKFLEECFENSLKFAEKVDFEFETGKYHVPKINTGAMSEKDYLEKITWEGIERRITKGREQGLEVPDWVIDKYEEQIPYELKVVDDLGLNGYLLVVQDIINWEKNNGIFVGPGRGSAAGSIVAYAIGITDLCPVQHKLLFERFINPNRKVMADIDWDSEMGGREKVLEYLIQTYGQDQVLNVATFGTYSPKSALQDMSRGLRKETGMDSILMKKINKLPGIAEEGVNKWKPKPGELIEFFKKVRKETTDADVINWIDNNQDTIKCADRLQGQMRNLGTHAGGIVVTPSPVHELIPVTRGSGNLITAFREADGSAKDLGELGILKLDVLGLKTLNVLKECCRRIKEDTGEDLYEKIYYLPLDDQKMIEAFASGNNFGIFQMDRSAMFTSTFKNDGAPVDSFEDIVAINAMNRPGPLEKFLPKYGKWKALDKEKVEYTPKEVEAINKERYPFEFMKRSLEQTHGCLDKDEKVYLPNTGTFKAIKDVVEGDIVFSKAGDGYLPANNKLTIHRGVNDIFEYTLKTGTKIKVTKDHRVNTLYGEMEIGKAFATGTSIMLPRVLQVNNKKESDLSAKREARLIGLLLSDGNFKRTNIVFTNSDPSLLANFEHLIENWYKECKIEKYHKKNDTYDLVVSGKLKRINPLNERLKELGLKGKGSRDKFIPDSYFLMDDDFKLRLLGGLFDGDGGATNENAYYKTMSPRLAEGIALLCRQLGMLPIVKTNSDGSTRVVLDLHGYKRISKFMVLDYKKRERETYPYYNQPDKAFVQEMMRFLAGSERAYCKQHGVNRKNHGKFYKNQSELRDVFERRGKTAVFDNNYFVQIASETFVKRDEVYDLSIAGEPWFVAGEGGILVHNCLLYQEQFMQMICDVTGMTFGDADSFRRAIAWRPDNPKYHTVKGYFDKLEESMISQGYTKDDVDKFVQYCRDFMGYSFNRSHSVVYSYVSWQTLFFKVYYPSYFYAAMLNMAGDTTEVQDIIEDAKKNNISIQPLSVTKSEYHSKAETISSIRLGYHLIKGLGESVEIELNTLALHKCRTIDEVLQKPFKKINSTALANLVRLGCFDEFGVERALIMKLKELYKEPKIEKWFSRKRNPAEEKTMPDVLSELFDVSLVMDKATAVKDGENPHRDLVVELTPHLQIENRDTEEERRLKRQKETIAAETELLGFSISEDEQFASFIKSMRTANFASFSEWNEEETPACYFKVVKITELKTKKGKPYWQYLLNDGKKDIKAKVWRQNTRVKEGDLGIGALEHSEFGWTLLKVEVI